jgi:tellurite resistance protein TehA-like permease
MRVPQLEFMKTMVRVLMFLFFLFYFLFILSLFIYIDPAASTYAHISFRHGMAATVVSSS